MFNNGDDGYGYGGGGFDTSGFDNGETPNKEKKGSMRSERIVPVTVRQIIESPDTGIKLYNTDLDVQIVKVMGIVKKITKSSLKIIYTIQDNTGTLEGIHWLEADTDEDFVVPVVDNTYCVMIGVIRNSTAQHNQKHIMVFKIYPVADLNEVTAHTLQIIYISLKADDLVQKPLSNNVPTIKQDMSSTYGGMDIDASSGNSYAVGFNLNPQHQRVLKAVAMAGQSEAGADIHEVMNAMTVKMPIKEVERILEFLRGEGHVYSTSDDQHFKATDSFG